ncbi:hypothetical protein L3X38_031962 [Prunus dulcis]|uniref:Uncharacterized protein n=1 Tax=Prunus dulcis TaxID=3755 RepID=A0AAD4VD72_PRUDU|nr:hypothetical protein L3X38_031962 [Prunus dulcis]
MQEVLERQERERRERMRRRAASKRVQRELDEQLGMAVALLEEENQSRRGSREGRAPNVHRHRHSRGENLLEDYFIPHSLYSDVHFRARYGMQSHLLNKVDEIARMGKSTILESLVRFCDAVKLCTPGTTCADLRSVTCNGFSKKLSLVDFLE